MNTHTHEVASTIESMHRLPNSTSGNPRWRIWLTSGLVTQTSKDAQVGHAMSKDLIGMPVQITLDERGEVIDMDWEGK